MNVHLKKNYMKKVGRPETGRKPFNVMCHPKVIADVRKFAKDKSEEYSHKLKQNEK